MRPNSKQKKCSIGKHAIFSLIMVIMIGCFSGSLIAAEEIVYRVAAKLVKVERTPAVQLEESPRIRGKRLWGDDIFDTAWNPGPSGFMVRLTNRTQDEVTVTWLKSWLIDSSGSGKKRMITPPSRLAGDPKNTKTTVIPSRKNVNITIQPRDYVTNQKAPINIETGMPQGTNESWVTPVFRQTYNKKQIKKTYKKMKKKHGKDFDLKTFIDNATIEVVLNMDVNGTKYTYRFVFGTYVFNL